MIPAQDERIAFTVNGQDVVLERPIGTTLAEGLRDGLSLKGTKLSCWESVCGSCTVIVDQRPVSACSTLLHEVATRDVLTVEGRSAVIDAVVRSFIDAEAFQCGFCTAGCIMQLVAALQEDAQLDDERLAVILDGNICRCGAYSRIRTAAYNAAAALMSTMQDSDRA